MLLKAPPPWIPPSSIIVPGKVDPFEGCGGGNEAVGTVLHGVEGGGEDCCCWQYWWHWCYRKPLLLGFPRHP